MADTRHALPGESGYSASADGDILTSCLSLGVFAVIRGAEVDLGS